MGYFYGVFIKELSIPPQIKALPVIPIEPNNMHITITYIGDRGPGQEVDRRVGASIGSIPCFKIRLGQLTLLPSDAKPRVLAIKIINDELLTRLRSIIISILRDSGIPISDRFLGDFKPHITIAYIKSKRMYPQDIIDSAREIGIEKEILNKSIPINAVSLILARENNYRELSRHKLQC